MKKRCLALLLVLATAICTHPALADDSQKPSTLPQKAAPVTGVTVYQNEKAAVDASNLTEGYVIVSYTGGKDVAIKVQIKRADLANAVTYTYNLNNKGTAETFPLTEGDGKYQISVLENIAGTKYGYAYSCTVEMKLRNAFLPYLYPNQYVNYTAQSKAVQKAAELVKGAATELDKVKAIYEYVIQNVTYDTELAKTVQPGYLPNVDTVLANKKGICFDYAALMSAMLRSQNLPCKLVVGYVGQVYHAWINVYIEDIGWVDSLIYFDGTTWRMMDPTFASAAGSDTKTLEKYVGDGKNYTAKYAY